MKPRTGGRGVWLAPAALGLLALALGALLLTVWRQPVLGLFLQPGRLEALVDRLGPAGPLAIVALQVLQIVVAPIPGQLVGIASGYLYGPWLGTAYSMAGVLLGNLLALQIARRWGRPVVERLVDAGALARADHVTQSIGLPVLWLIYLLPFLPGDTITLVAGLTEIPIRSIMLAVLFGRLPGIFISSCVGHTATALTARQWIAIGALALVAAAAVLRWRAPLQRRMWSLVERFSHRPTEGSEG